MAIKRLPPETASAAAQAKLRATLKRTIVTLAIAGWLPIPVADFLIRHGGLAHD